MTTLIGFDCRVVDNGVLDDLWPSERRALYLLNVAATREASVDTSVWPSVFTFGDTDQIPSAATNEIVLPYNDLRQQAFGLWTDADEMSATLARHRRLDQGTRIAIGVLDADVVANVRPWDDLLRDPVRPGQLGKHWQLLGYDVADRDMLSGLSNCGYVQDDAAFRAQWSSRVNDVGLLTTPTDAVGFKVATDRRVPEHAPFIVYSIHEWASQDAAQ